MSDTATRLRAVIDRTVLMAFLAGLMLAAPRTVVAQTCGLRLQPSGATEIAYQGRDLIEQPMVGVRHYRDRLWGGLFLGDVPPTVGLYEPFGLDENGSYFGLLEADFWGGAVQLGVGERAGPLAVCADGSVQFGVERSASRDKFYDSGLFVREDLNDFGLSAWLWTLSISVDHAIGERASAGLGGFVQRSVVNGDEAPDPFRGYSYVGVSAGVRALAARRILLALSFLKPLHSLDDAFEEPDGWFSVSVGLLL